MRMFLLFLVNLGLSLSASSQDCFDQLDRAIDPGDRILLITRDDAKILGINPIIISGQARLRLTVLSDSTAPRETELPFSEIDRLSYRKKGLARGFFAIVGLAAGAIIGAVVTDAAFSSSGSSGSIPTVRTFGGVLLGGALGAIGGHALGSAMPRTVTLRCHPPTAVAATEKD